jgi:hypothetical protein
MTNAVITAEKRPALRSIRNRSWKKDQETYEDQQGINVFSPAFDRGLVVFFQNLIAFSPCPCSHWVSPTTVYLVTLGC